MSARTCPSCGATFNAARGVRYCSLTCQPSAIVTPPRQRSGHHDTSPTQRGYDHRWRALAKVVLERDGHVCQLPVDDVGHYDPTETSPMTCGQYANAVDHVIEFNGVDDPLRLDITNCRAACKPCNSAKAAHNTTRKRRATKQGMM